MSKVVDLTHYKKDKEAAGVKVIFAALAMCLQCQNRWVAGVTNNQSIFMLECPECNVQDSFASIIPKKYLADFGVDYVSDR